MRVLNFLNLPFAPEQLQSGGQGISTSGGWMAVLLGRLLAETDFALATTAFGPVRQLECVREGMLTTYTLPAAFERKGSGLDLCRAVVRDWKPDVIHIHGTENVFGRLTSSGALPCPVVISIQGLLGPCSEWYRYFGNRRLWEIVSMHRWLEIPALRGQWMEYRKLQKMASAEHAAIAGNRFFMGRTDWDRAYIASRSPAARYYHVGELLREPFWRTRWELTRATPHRILFTNAGHPRKGAQVVLDATRLLKPEYPGIDVVVAGAISKRNGYGTYIRRRMAETGCVQELGGLDAARMAHELAASHVFVSSSFIENSSNACCEAQLIGMPVISSYTGGMPSLIEEGRTGLFFPTGDAPMLAARLRQLFEDEALATRLGAQAHEVASRRHHPDRVVRDIAAVYREVAGESS